MCQPQPTTGRTALAHACGKLQRARLSRIHFTPGMPRRRQSLLLVFLWTRLCEKTVHVLFGIEDYEVVKLLADPGVANGQI